MLPSKNGRLNMCTCSANVAELSSLKIKKKAKIKNNSYKHLESC